MIEYKNKKGQVVHVLKHTLNSMTSQKVDDTHYHYRSATSFIKRLYGSNIRIGKLWHPGTERN